MFFKVEVTFTVLLLIFDVIYISLKRLSKIWALCAKAS